MPGNIEGGRRTPSIHRLPYEITSTIFVIFVNLPSFERWHRLYAAKGPLSLGAVCRLWRCIAWSTTRLWTTIKCDIGSKTSETFMEIAADWLSRSGQHALSIDLSIQEDISNVFWKSGSAGYMSVVNLANEYAHRCYHLSLRIPAAMFPLLDITNASALQDLEIYSDYGKDDDILNFGLGTAPTNVHIFGIQLKLCVMNWDYVTTAVMSSLYVDELLELLTLAPRLKECHVEQLVATDYRAIEKFKSVTHTHLETLSYGFSCDTTMMDRDPTLFFERATLLKLSEFSCHFSDQEIPTPAFVGFIERSSLLKDLSLYGMTLSEEEDLVHILQAAPHLAVLDVQPYLEELSTSVALEAFCEALSMSRSHLVSLPHEKPFLPLLENLTIMPGPNFPWHVLPGFFCCPTNYTDRPIRVLKEVYIGSLPLEWYEYIPLGNFIDDRGLLDELVNLRNIKLTLHTKQKYGLVDMIRLSYRMLNAYERSGGDALTDSEEEIIHQLSRV